VRCGVVVTRGREITAGRKWKTGGIESDMSVYDVGESGNGISVGEES